MKANEVQGTLSLCVLQVARGYGENAERAVARPNSLGCLGARCHHPIVENGKFTGKFDCSAKIVDVFRSGGEGQYPFPSAR